MHTYLFKEIYQLQTVTDALVYNTLAYNAQYIGFAMAMYNYLEYSGNYSKISGSFSQCCRDKRTLDYGGAIVDFTNYDTTDSFKLNEKVVIAQEKVNDGTKGVEIP